MSAAPDAAAIGALAAAAEAARARSLAWFETMAIERDGAPLWRESAAADPDRWPGMLLPGTYNAAMCLRLIGGLEDAPPARLAATARWIAAQRGADGGWWIQGAAEADLYKKPDIAETRRYFQWHVSNYTLGALEALGADDKGPLDFAAPYLDVAALDAWLAARDLRDPWQEGNNIVNLGSFLLKLRARPETQDQAAAALERLMAWHDETIDPRTGFWGAGQDTELGLLHAMAGATHNYHLYFELGRPIPAFERAIDYCLTQPPIVVSACIDADLADILANAALITDHRRGEIRRWLLRLADAILEIQNADGGFADQLAPGVRRFDGWARGYEEPHRISCGFATFFRWITLAMALRVLAPETRDWTFRRMPGLGYFRRGSRRQGAR